MVSTLAFSLSRNGQGRYIYIYIYIYMHTYVSFQFVCYMCSYARAAAAFFPRGWIMNYGSLMVAESSNPEPHKTWAVQAQVVEDL